MGTVHELFPTEQASAPSNTDRQPLTIKEDSKGHRWVGIEQPDGELAPPEGVRTERASRPLGLEDRLICWYPGEDRYEIVRVGSMTYDDLIAAAHYYEWRGKPSLLGQALLWLWWHIHSPLMDDRDATIESVIDDEGHDALDFHWQTAL